MSLKLIRFIIICCSIIISLVEATNPPIIDDYGEAITLASIINAECGTCETREMIMVGLVVLNRVHAEEFPRTISAVIQQDNQFEGVDTEHYKPTEKTYKIAVELIQSYNSFSGGKYKQIKYFYHPDKATDHKFIRQMRNRILFKEKEHVYCK